MDTTIHIKVNQNLWNEFKDKVKNLDKRPSDFIREIISAYNDDRLVIILTPEQEQLFGVTTNSKGD